MKRGVQSPAVLSGFGDKGKMVLKNKKRDELKESILKLLKKAERPISTQEISVELNKPWHSVQTRCLMLQVDKKVVGFRVGRINLWQSG